MKSYEELNDWCKWNGISLHQISGPLQTELSAYRGHELICRSKGLNDPLLYKEMQRFIIDTLTHNEVPDDQIPM